jgi:choline dehydrogenase-like flavoprotein
MAFLNIDTQKKRTYDAIVIGSGISGGWAAKELTGHGLKTLVLERGRDVKHVTDYPTANLHPWELEHRGQVPLDVRAQYGKVRSMVREETLHWAVKESEQPYIEDKPFNWTRGYHVGGKSLLWARQTQRWSDFDFEGPARDGFAVDWPIRYADLAPWYSYVETFAGISGNRDGLAELPDGEFMPPMELSCVELHLKDSMAQNYQGRHLVSGRCAHISDPQPIHHEQGRAKCQHRTLCVRGCPLGGYFSSNASTLPWAEKTGKMTLRPHSVVHSVIYDERKQKAIGVRVIDANTREMTEYYARILFVNASALNSNLLLLNSVSSRFPNGLGNDSGLLGKYIAWHNYRARMSASYEGLADKMTDGRNPSHGYIPRFRNVFRQETDFLRGYAAGVGTGRSYRQPQDGLGNDLKAQLHSRTLGNWHVSSWMMGETLPKESSFLTLDKVLTDPYGIPQLRISADWDDNDDKMVKDYMEQFTEMFTKAGFTNIKATDSHSAPGSDIHEMGGVRMGHDPKTSLLNKWNQLHAVPNVFVTDGACMTSTSTQNPSLTYMALTARAADYAVKELKKRNL